MCWFSIAKYLLFAFNFVLWLGGAAVLGIGIYLVTAGGSEVVAIGGVDFYAAGAYVLIAAGACAFLLGFLGCCGASKESTCLLGIYFSALIVIFILEVGVGIWAVVNYDSVDDLIADSIDSYDLTGDEESATTQTYIGMEQTFECCGKNNSCQDWYAAGQSQPYGCDCKEGESEYCVPRSQTSCIATGSTYNYIYNQNCTTAMTNFVEENMTLIAGIGLGIGLAEILGMIFSICMCCAIKEKQGYA